MFILANTGIVVKLWLFLLRGLTAVNYVDLEQYLYSVVGSEVFYSWPLGLSKPSSRRPDLRPL
jgi:peptidoglycan hydrolase-like amidase